MPESPSDPTRAFCYDIIKRLPGDRVEQAVEVLLAIERGDVVNIQKGGAGAASGKGHSSFESRPTPAGHYSTKAATTDGAAWSPSDYTPDAPSVGSGPSFQRLPDLAHSHVMSFLPLYDLLRMSMVEKWLRVPCLKQITKLKLRYHAGSYQEALNRLLQQLEGIDLRVPDQRTVTSLESAVRGGHGGGVKELRVNANDICKTQAERSTPRGMWYRDSFDRLWRSLELLPSLSDLHLSFENRVSGVYLGTLNAALAGGACPALEGLVLDDIHKHDSMVELAAAFEQRPKTCKMLLRLTISGVDNAEDTLEAVERILLSHTCAELEQLHLTSIFGCSCDRVIATYLRHTGAPKLQEALFESVKLDETVQALSQGTQSLTSLNLRGGFSKGAFSPVADPIRTRGAWYRLRFLQLEDLDTDHHDLDALFGAIGGAHGCPNLRELAVNMWNGSVAAVPSAIGMGAFGALETLRFFAFVEDVEVTALEAALQRNPLPSLTTLKIGCIDSDAPLVRAFRGGACSNLRRMYLYHGNTDGNLALVLKDGWGKHLRSLSLEVACGALARIIDAVACSGACPALQELEVEGFHRDLSTLRTLIIATEGVLPPHESAHDAMVRNLATILSSGAACSSSLVKLSLSGWDIDPDDMRVLSSALSLPTSARNAILHLTGMERLGDAGVRHLVDAMQEGLGAWLREVDQTRSQYDRRVFTGFDRWCPHLEKVVGHEDITARAQQRRVSMLW